MRILNFGSLNLDEIYRVPRFVAPGETLASAGRTVNFGGKGLNQSVALARAGAPVFHAGCIGPEGGPIAAFLKENGVDVQFLLPVSRPQGRAVIQVTDTGENCILLFGGSNEAVSEQQADEVLAHFDAGDWLVLQNEIPCVEYLVRQAAARGMYILLNPSPFSEALRGLNYNALCWLAVNEVEARQLTGETRPEKVWAALHKAHPQLNLLLTLGGDGAVCFTPREQFRQAAFPARAADTTGAGDTFTGFFLAGLTAGLPLPECMRHAAMAAALCVTRPGAAHAIPTAGEVERALRAGTAAFS